ncbi:MAG TPA: TetR/AcrR family transcriptional regulator, partial [Labilithrix sp.]
KGLLYHYFPTKKAFYAETVRGAAEKLLALCDIHSDATPLDQLAQGIDAYLDFVREHRAAYTTLMRSGAFVDREIGRIVDDGREKFVALLTEGIIQAFPDRERPPLFDLALRGWVGMAERASLSWLEMLGTSPRRAPSQPQVRDLLAKALIAIVAELAI